MSLRASWVTGSAGSLFDVHNLPYGVFSRGGGGRRVGVAIGAHVLDLSEACTALGSPHAGLFAVGTLDPLLAAGPATWRAQRAELTDWLTDPRTANRLTPHLVPVADVDLHLPFTVADYVDFYASEQHATNLGRLFRPGQEPLPTAWRHLPIGYHGRSGTVVVSGSPVPRPHGQRWAGEPGGRVVVAPTARLDVEVEVGFVVGVGSELGTPVPTGAFADHVFGIVLLNDWSARDIQSYEYVPLGPFLGKSFATSISPWVVPLAALDRVPAPVQDPPVAAYLETEGDWGLDLTLSLVRNGEEVSRPPFAGMYWTGPQMLAHLTANGASLRTGDLFASGTVSGDEVDQRGSFIELSWNKEFLADGDVVAISATTASGRYLGEVTGRVLPS